MYKHFHSFNFKPCGLLMVFFLSLILVGCSPNLLEVLDNSPCVVPCWYGIIPGETTKEEAISMLRKIKAIDNSLVTWSGQYNSYLWRIGKGDFFGETHIDENVVDYIIIYDPGFPLTENGITLAQALTLFGPPEILAINKYNSGDSWGYSINLLFPRKGLILVSKAGDLSHIILRPGTKIHKFIFFEQKGFEELFRKYFLSDTGLPIEYQIPWTGYGKLNIAP